MMMTWMSCFRMATMSLILMADYAMGLHSLSCCSLGANGAGSLFSLSTYHEQRGHKVSLKIAICVVFKAKEVEDKYIAAVHSKSHINLIKTISSRKRVSERNKVAAKYDDIYFNEGSSQSAYLAAGSVLEGVTRTFFENSKTLRLPTHLHERLSAIRNAKAKLERKGITPSIDRIAETLNMSRKKVTNATEAVCKVYSLDKAAFPSINGIPGETLHSYIADDCPDNNPWHGIDEGALKDEVRNLIKTTLGQREREIIYLYYGLDNEYLTWEDISRRKGLSRERVRQVGLVALEKLKNAARNTKLAAMLVSY